MWAFILGPIVKPLNKKMGNPQDWSNKAIYKGMIIGLVPAKLGLWGVLIALAYDKPFNWIVWLLWIPAMFGLNVVLFMMIVGWVTALEFKKEVKTSQ